ncbi:hypothetical protein ASD97_10035 [Streptomyces sp. Root63]|uniref:hypothetical protein n=1 Tax=unclassified Streptomyces TaxID=2593676 RepID=UPI0006F63441|nr:MULTISPECIES: hypothetical protein [unclassified Streptomyces]KQX36999.1 hypothetical protein ASD29_07195 [Streptomyces sp. Root1295]KRA43940.1 hypothetical protein ASD97_10035 [Streptomyces sp. Root63]
MWKPPVDPEVAATFRADADGFISRSPGGVVSSPPYVIASCAVRRVPHEALTLPDGYDQDVLGQIITAAGFIDQDVRVTGRQAEELAQIGAQLLELDSQGKVQHPLGHFEMQSVAHLVHVVAKANRDGAAARP